MTTKQRAIVFLINHVKLQVTFVTLDSEFLDLVASDCFSYFVQGSFLGRLGATFQRFKLCTDNLFNFSTTTFHTKQRQTTPI